MGRQAAVNYEQIAAAADQLQSEGLTPTAKYIRTRLGSVGSLGTIQKHLMEWRSKHGSTQSAARILPPEVQRAVFKFLDEEVSRINGELRQQVDEAHRGTADIAADNEELTMTVSQLRAELAEQASLKDRQDGQLSRLLDELEAVREEIESKRCEAELARHELTKIQSRIEAQAPVERELRQLRADFETERECRVSAEREAAVLKAQKDSLEARIVELKEAASVHARAHGSGGDQHVGNQPEHGSLAVTNPGKEAENTAELSAPSPRPALDSATNAAGEQNDPRQARLC